MKSADFKCDCGSIRTIFVKKADDFPETVPCFGCEVGIAKRIYSPIPSIVHQGTAGNARNGYTSSPVSIKKS